MEQYTDSQYDDDLTIGTDDYDDSDVDLFEFGGDEDSAISRLKTLVLSIDWEITDEVLIQFNEEILDLKDVWAGEKIEMVYLQALEKIGKYIYREKADSHPNAIRLLLSMYYNLERIVLSNELSGSEKKKILIEDVRRFEKLKNLIGKEKKTERPVVPEPIDVDQTDEEVDALRDLKAIVLGIDWEITDVDLLALREEVDRLEEMFSASKPKLVFLQGIGTVGAYIRKKKSNAHADAFKLLHSFYEGLEKLFRSPDLTLEQEKEILRPEVQKFNAFKVIIADTLSKPDMESGEFEDDEGAGLSESGSVVPAFADLPEEGTQGFLEEVESKALDIETPVNVDEHINKFFGDDEPLQSAIKVAPKQETVETFAATSDAEKEAEEFSAAFFDGSLTEESAATVDREVALQGVDVETEADDDSDEDALPVLGGEIAPALVDPDDFGEFNEIDLKEDVPAEELSEEITGRLDDFFGVDEETEKAEEVTPALVVPADVALQGVNVETEADEEEVEEGAPPEDIVAMASDELAPAFADIEEESSQPAELLADDSGPAVLALDDLPEETFEEIPAALYDEEVSDISTADVAEEAVEQRFDELFGATEGEDSSDLQESGVEELQTAFEVPADVALQGVNVETEDDEEVIPSEDVVTLASEELAPAFAEMDEDIPKPAESLADDSEPAVLALDDFPEESFEEIPAALFDEEVSEVVEADVEEDIEAFFSLDEEESLEPAPALDADDIDQAFLDIDERDIQTITPEPAEEDIIFEPTEEVVTSAEEQHPALDVTSEDSILADEAAIPPLDLGGMEVAPVAALASLGAAEVTDESPAEKVAEPPSESLDNLRGCVQSLNLELSDEIVQGLFTEINSLRQCWVDRPVEKTFLQLMSTVVQHIGQYRYNANDESSALLASIMEDLDSSQVMEVSKKQEILLGNTCKVLQWQQGMLDSQAVRGDDGHLTFSDADTAITAESPFDETMIEKESSEDIHAALLEEEASFDMDLEEALNREIEEESEKVMAISPDDPDFPDVVRREIDTLRDTLKREIAELRKAMDIESGEGK